MAAGHLVADGNLSLLRNVAADHFIDTGAQLIAVGPGEFLHVHDDAVFSVWHAQGGIAHLARLFAEDGAQQALLGGELCLALGRYLADKDVTGMDLRADADHAELVEILERVLADIRDGSLSGTDVLAM